MTTWEMRSNQKPKRCTAQYPFTGTFQNGHRCTLEVGHTGPHTILPPSGMDYAQDDDPRVTMDDGVSYCDRHHRFDCPDCAEIAALEEEEDAADSSCNLEFADSDVQHYALRRHEWRQAKIAALRKELGT